MNQVNDLKKELELLKSRFNEQYAELVVAQQKRSGHYKKLEYQIEQNKKLQKEIDFLKETIANKNKDFLSELVAEKYNFNDESFNLLLEKFNEIILANDNIKKENKVLSLENNTLKTELENLKKGFSTLHKEARIAQEKRAGHYAKLEASLLKNKELEQKNIQLSNALINKQKTLTWLLGEALLGCRTFKGLLLFPIKIIQANKKFKNYRTNEILFTNEQSPLGRNETTKLTDANEIKATKSTDTKSIDKDIVDISILGWPKPNNDKPVTIMCIADTFTTSNLKSVANLITPRPDNWKGLLNRDSPALLFVESAWNGNQNSWQYRVGSYANPPGKELFDAIHEFKSRNLPTIFWNKEDPVHFDKFKNSAKEFDYIFTSDEGSISAYQKISKAQVFALPFAADSSINNPIGSSERQDKVCFAGSYYANRFIERRNDQIMLLESALPYGLDIYDRNAGNTNKDFHFPEQFTNCIRGSLPYDKMNQVYKQYKLFLNVNSVIDSKTMFSRRVFELLASGTPIVSTPSVGIDEFFGRDLVWTVQNKEEAQEAIYTLLNNQEEWRRRSLGGIRKIFTEHTFQDRFNSILQIVGVNKTIEKPVQILCCVEAVEQSDIDALKNIINNQYKANKFELLPFIILRNDKLKTELPNVVSKHTPVFQLIGQYLKQNHTVDFVSLFSNKNIYGKYYLLDLYLATTYSRAQIVSKPEQDSYNYTDTFVMTGSLINRDVFVLDKLILSDKVNGELIKTSCSVFLGDSANFSNKIGDLKMLLAKIEI